MWWKKKDRYRIHYLNTVIECTEGSRFIPVNNGIFFSASVIEYRDCKRDFDIIVLTNGNDTYFECNSIINLFGLNFAYLSESPKIVSDRFGKSYIHYDSICDVLCGKNKYGAYNERIHLINQVQSNNRIDRNNTIECITRKLKIISNIGGYSSWKKLK